MKTCKTCKVRKPREAFYNHPYTKDKKLPNCNDCHNDETRFLRIKNKYGLTVEGWYAIWCKQDKQCKICGKTSIINRPNEVPSDFAVDHKHGSDPIHIRGILCRNCNTALGHAKESPEILRKMANYLEIGEPTDIAAH